RRGISRTSRHRAIRVACALQTSAHSFAWEHMLPSGYYRTGLLFALLGVLELFTAPLISTATLITALRIFDIELTQRYVLLAILSALLCYTLVRQDTTERQGLFVSGWTLATRAGIAWLAVVGLLLLIGYATKVSSMYSRAALFVWFTAAAPLLMAAPV